MINKPKQIKKNIQDIKDKIEKKLNKENHHSLISNVNKQQT